MSEDINSRVDKMLKKLEKDRYISSEKTIEFGLEIYSLCTKENYEIGMAVVLLYIGQAYSIMSKYEEAMKNLFISVELSQKQGICDLKLLAYINIGNTYFDIGEYEKSLVYYNFAKKLERVFNSSNNYYKNLRFGYYAVKIYINIGEIYRVLRCYEDADIYYNMAINFDRKLNYIDPIDIGITLCNLGYVAYHLGNYGKALEYLNKSLTYLINNDYKLGIVEAYGLFALIHEKRDNYTESEKYFLKAIDIAIEIDYTYGKIDLLLDFSNFFDSIGERKKSN